MGIITHESEVTTSIPPTKLFNAFILDDNLIPKALPQAIKSVEIIEGDGGVGSIKLITFGEGSQYKSAKHRVDKLDKVNFVYGYTVIEGDAFKDVIEKVCYVVKIEGCGDGGSVCKTSSTYHTKGDAVITEEQIKAGKEKALQMFKAVEAHLLAHPDAYN
ncbi:hypothetical protein ACH5RR_031957 [Cinchona calisaya]|uniref:Bet v I/Major latex protein domain-containing protein n=1 Tax=Cinchona calisaya TaxID=153742 RepID=A0ABD2YHT0_9GENT